MGSATVVADLHKIVQQMMKIGEVSKYKIEIQGEGGTTEGFLGDIIFFSVTEINGNQVYLVFKTAKRSQTLRNSTSCDVAYHRELTMYSHVFPALQLFLMTKNMSDFLNFIPKSYFISKTLNEESIILENLKIRNFCLWGSKKPMDMAHIKLVFETYGKWHGLTMAYRDQNPEKFSDMVKHWVNVKAVIEKNIGLGETYHREFRVILKMLSDCGRKDLVNIYQGLENQIDYVMLRKGDKEDFVCITHGDCWINNFMFQYEKMEDLRPQNVCFLDFQMCTADSPVTDLSSFFYNVADEIAYHNFNSILDVYFNSLSTTIKSLGSDPEKVFSRKDLRKHWTKYGLYGTIRTVLQIKLQLSDSDEAPDMYQMAERGESLIGSFGFEIRDMARARQRILEAFIHYGDFLRLNRI